MELRTTGVDTDFLFLSQFAMSNFTSTMFERERSVQLYICGTLKIAVHLCNLNELHELGRFCLEQWTTVIPEKHAKLVHPYPKAIIGAQDGPSVWDLFKQHISL